MQLSREEIILRFNESKKKQRTNKQIRPRQRKRISKRPSQINTEIDEHTSNSLLNNAYKKDGQWLGNKLLFTVVPYKLNDSRILEEYESKIIRWYHYGVNPFTNERSPPTNYRSAFDYMTDSQLKNAIIISNNFNLYYK